MSPETGSRPGQRRTGHWSRRCRLAVSAALVTLAPRALALEDHETGERSRGAGDHAEAVRIWRALAETGDKFAQYELGNAYKKGEGVSQDEREAADWWRRAAEQDFAPAQYNLATQYYLGHGVPKDEEAAIRWYWRAAENGHPRAQRLFDIALPPPGETPARASGTTAVPPSPSRGGASNATESAAVATDAGPSAPSERLSDPSPIAPAAAGYGTSWLLAQNPNHYTIQLLANHSEDRLRAYLDAQRFSEPVAHFRFRRDGEQWYAAVHGSYPSASQAREALSTLPPETRKTPPWIRRFDGIHELIESP